ncbi:MAG: hypothetical protein KF819_40500 [Labilithrix sp.]|nr:hypothetical protein [Labilithrix sp.]
MAGPRFPRYRSAYAIAVALAVTLGPVRSRASQPDPAAPGVTASMQCDRASEPGRVKCTIEARTDGKKTLSWADAEIVLLPELATALKGRIGPQDATSRDAVSAKWAFGLVARKAGQGEAVARVRAVVCEGTKCHPVIVPVRAAVVVGG